ncbi:MAG TPA: GDSL-type esterase/lipase family protein [bacterium]|nr:GDSL-type esterase/lipase family protein [bacterium]HPR88916.1 GDSL-type esterase/lipase family protein [bacterium]
MKRIAALLSPLLAAAGTVVLTSGWMADACGSPPGALAARHQGMASTLVVVLGSSTALGTGANPPDSSWVNRYRSYLRYYSPDLEVVNLAVGGITTFQIMPDGFIPPSRRFAPIADHNISYALTLHPAAIIVNLPSNDAANYFPITAQLANFDTLAQYASRNQTPIWFSTSQPRNFLDPGQRLALMVLRDSLLARYADGIWTRTLDFWSGLADSAGNILPPFDCGDHIHLNNSGHRLLCERVVQAHVLLYTGVTRAPTEVPEAVHLDASFPNPFNSSTLFRYELASGSPVEVTLHDLRGREVARLFAGFQLAGAHELRWDAAASPGGVYLIVIRAGGTMQSRLLTLVK